MRKRGISLGFRLTRERYTLDRECIGKYNIALEWRALLEDWAAFWVHVPIPLMLWRDGVFKGLYQYNLENIPKQGIKKVKGNTGYKSLM